MSEKQPRRISSEEREHFVRSGFSGDIYVEPKDDLGFSALMVDVFDSHPLKQMVGATRSYLVLSGVGKFQLNGEGFDVGEGDLIIIPDGGVYKYQGIMRLFELNVPATTSANSITLEEQ